MDEDDGVCGLFNREPKDFAWVEDTRVECAFKDRICCEDTSPIETCIIADDSFCSDTAFRIKAEDADDLLL